MQTPDEYIVDEVQALVDRNGLQRQIIEANRETIERLRRQLANCDLRISIQSRTIRELENRESGDRCDRCDECLERNDRQRVLIESLRGDLLGAEGTIDALRARVKELEIGLDHELVDRGITCEINSETGELIDSVSGAVVGNIRAVDINMLEATTPAELCGITYSVDLEWLGEIVLRTPPPPFRIEVGKSYLAEDGDVYTAEVYHYDCVYCLSRANPDRRFPFNPDGTSFQCSVRQTRLFMEVPN